MRRASGFLGAVSLSVLLPLGGTALAAPAANGYGTTPPVVGDWKIISYAQGDPGMVKGQFVVTAHHKSVRGFTATPTSDFRQNCGSKAVSVVGQPTIRHFTGVNHYGLDYSEWTVGKAAGDGNLDPVKVTLESAGVRFAGKLKLVFETARGGRQTGAGPPKSEGELSYTLHGRSACDVSFLFKKK